MYKIKISQIIQPMAILLMMALFISCQDNAKSDDDKQLLSKEQKDMIAQEREDLTKKIEKQMNAVDYQIELINKKMTVMGVNTAEDLEAGYKESMTELKSFRSDLETKRKAVAETTEENWEEFKTDLKPYLNKVEADMKSLASKIEDVLTKDEK